MLSGTGVFVRTMTVEPGVSSSGPRVASVALVSLPFSLPDETAARVILSETKLPGTLQPNNKTAVVTVIKIKICF